VGPRPEGARVSTRVRTAIALADERARVAWRLGAVDTVRAAVRAGRRTRRQLALVVETEGLPDVSIPESGALEPTDARSFEAFARLLPQTPPGSLLELLWYVRFARDGARTLLVARDGAGRPSFSTWMLDAEGQREHASRFGDGFHRLGEDELLIEGIFTFPHARGRGVGAAGIAAACAWAGQRGAARVWGYPYLDNPQALPPFARAGFEPVGTRVEVTSLGQLRAWAEPLTECDRNAWNDPRAAVTIPR